MCYIQNCINIGENSRKILSAQHYDFQWGIFKSPVPRPEFSLMHRPKSALTCWFSSVHWRQPYYTGISPRQRQNDALRFYWHRSLIACAVGSARKGAGRNDIRSILCKGLMYRRRQKTLQNPWLFQPKARLISSYLSWLDLTKGPVGCSLWGDFVNRTWFWMGHREPF